MIPPRARGSIALWIACAGIGGLAVAAELTRPVNPDIALFLYDAGRVLDGAQLYRDVVEINPPLIVVLNMPVVLLARSTHLSEFLLYRLATLAVLAGLLLCAARLAHRYLFPDQRGRARYLVLLLCFAFFALARIDFGQREHFVLALLMPYVLLVAAERSGRRPLSLESGAIGILAGVAVALKPHFVLVWLVLEGFRRLRGPAAERWRLTPELAGTVGFVATYVLAVRLLTPDYFVVLALLGPAYGVYLREPFANLLVVGPGAPLLWFVLLACIGLRRQTRYPELVALLASATAACFLAGAAQEKEFRYHFYPALGLAFVLLGVLATGASDIVRLKSERIYSRAVQALLLAVVAPVGVLSYTIESAFPLVNDAGVPLAVRFPGLWPFAASYWDAIRSGGAVHYHAVGEMPPFERYFFGAVRDDLLATRPNLLLMLRPARDAPQNGLRRLHYVQYFGRDPELAAFLDRYELVTEKGEYLLYQRRGSEVAPIGPPPSAAPATLDAQRAPRLGEVRVGHLDPESVLGLGIFVIGWLAAAAADRRRAGRIRLEAAR